MIVDANFPWPTIGLSAQKYPLERTHRDLVIARLAFRMIMYNDYNILKNVRVLNLNMIKVLRVKIAKSKFLSPIFYELSPFMCSRIASPLLWQNFLQFISLR